MTTAFHANQVGLTLLRSATGDDAGEVILTFDCAYPKEDGSMEVVDTIYIGMAYGNAKAFAELFKEYMDRPLQPAYRGPSVSTR